MALKRNGSGTTQNLKNTTRNHPRYSRQRRIEKMTDKITRKRLRNRNFKSMISKKNISKNMSL